MPTEPINVGYDPIVWIQRLLYVSHESKFTNEQKKLIKLALFKLWNDLDKL